MWVLLALFWANTDGNDLERWMVYKDRTFNTYHECQTVLLENRNQISTSLGNLNISNKFSVKCVDAHKYPQILGAFNKRKM